MRFLDEAKIFVASGAGGAGAVSFRREKFVEFGGPDGGNGGRGGDVLARVDHNLNTLIDFRYRQHFKAKRGEGGKGANRTGAAAESIILNVPPGTQILDEDKETLLYDLTEEGPPTIIARGGDGGRGNASFKSAVNRAPRRHEPGWPGEERWLWLRLKLIADIGLIGLPNAGKSSLLTAMTRARPKIGAYPFTTLHPELGVIEADGREAILADVPGLIEGAHQGRGLGIRFLGHVERCRILAHVIDISETIEEDFHIVQQELAAYGAGLAEKPRVMILNKSDLCSPAQIKKRTKQLESALTGAGLHKENYTLFCVSAASGQGISDLIPQLVRLTRSDLTHNKQPELPAQEALS